MRPLVDRWVGKHPSLFHRSTASTSRANTDNIRFAKPSVSSEEPHRDNNSLSTLTDNGNNEWHDLESGFTPTEDQIKVEKSYTVESDHGVD